MVEIAIQGIKIILSFIKVPFQSEKNTLGFMEKVLIERFLRILQMGP